MLLDNEGHSQGSLKTCETFLDQLGSLVLWLKGEEEERGGEKRQISNCELCPVSRPLEKCFLGLLKESNV